ncbi:hypothetical protein AMELA_G00101590 [Ameiurus melas]|uniref:Uncharacterized protein n=1 Tax=Ameiurus melas TaxID=219545 RepID=A0A7J6ATA0_AMEME|nr:hypothetical protein AMELA_G00101590 [Ameiurus melas]
MSYQWRINRNRDRSGRTHKQPSSSLKEKQIWLRWHLRQIAKKNKAWKEVAEIREYTMPVQFFC